MIAKPSKGKIYWYIRHSKAIDDQKNSPEMQRSIIRSWMDSFTKQGGPLEGLSFGGEFYDADVSAFSVSISDRPAGRQLLNTVQRGDFIVFAAFDRAWRSVLDFYQTTDLLRKRDVGWAVANQPELNTASAIGKLMVGIVALFSEYTSSLMSERTSQGLKNVIYTRGIAIINQAPLGYKLAPKPELGLNKRGHPYKVCVPCHETRKLARKAWSLFYDEDLSETEVFEHMERYYDPPPTSLVGPGKGKWCKETLRMWFKHFRKWDWANGPRNFPVKKWQLTGLTKDKEENLYIWVEDPEEPVGTE